MSELHDLVAPYALNALEPLERLRFETHLESCTQCQEELHGFAATAAKLGASSAQTPPPALRDAILTAASRTPQDRPARLAATRRSSTRIGRLAIAAALAIGLAGAGGYLVERHRANEQINLGQVVESVMAAADAEIQTERLPGGGVLRFVTSDERDTAVVMAYGLPDPGTDKTYQMWAMTENSPASVGTMTDAGTMVLEKMGSFDQVAFTVEPRGGSEKPTTEPIAAFSMQPS